MRYFPDQCRTLQMCDKSITENGRTLKAIIKLYKIQEICDKVVDDYVHALEFAICSCNTLKHITLI